MNKRTWALGSLPAMALAMAACTTAVAEQELAGAQATDVETTENKTAETTLDLNVNGKRHVLKWTGEEIVEIDDAKLKEMLSDLEDLDFDFDFEFSDGKHKKVFALKMADLSGDMEHLKESLKKLESLESLEGLHELKVLKHLEGLKGLEAHHGFDIEVLEDGEHKIIINKAHSKEVKVIDEDGVKIITSDADGDTNVTVTEDAELEAKIITVERADGKRTVITITED